MTPEEAQSGRRPVVDHFRIFVCIAYAHVPAAKRKKLDEKGEKCVFLGVIETFKAYKLFNPVTVKFVISMDVIFYEENTWNWDDQQPSQTFVDTEIEDERQQPLNHQTQATLELESSPNEAPIATEAKVVEPSRILWKPAWMEILR